MVATGADASRCNSANAMKTAVVQWNTMGYSGTPNPEVCHMPTTNPRVNVTLSPSLDSLVSRLAAIERVSKSMVLRELLEAAEPSLLSAVALMEAAKGASVEARKRIARDMQSTVDAAKGVNYLAQSVAANSTRDIVAEAEAIRGRRPPRRARAAGAPGRHPATGKSKPKALQDPPISNRGVKS